LLQKDDDEPFEEKMARLRLQLQAQFEESARLEQTIKENMKRMGYE
jgi:type I restriction enzyme M protein